VKIESEHLKTNDQNVVSCLPWTLEPEPSAGQFITNRTRIENPEFNFLPLDEYPTNCVSYGKIPLIVQESHKGFFSSEAIIDSIMPNTLFESVGNDEIVYSCYQQFTSASKLYLVYDRFYIESNPDHYNLEIDFLVKTGNEYEDFDFRTAFPPQCGQSYDGKIPYLTGAEETTISQPPYKVHKRRKVEGTITYTMNGFGFDQIFSNKSLKLRFLIKDRSLNYSNIVETPEFTLSGIKKN